MLFCEQVFCLFVPIINYSFNFSLLLDSIMEDLIHDLVLLLVVSLPINIIFHRFRLPSVMGFIAAGLVIGPYGLKLVGDLESVEKLAEIGVVLLLFVVGLEFSLGRLLEHLAKILKAGGLQILLGSLGAFGILRFWGVADNAAILIALLATLSSTAIVMKMIAEAAELETSHGQICVGILLIQDLAVVPILLIMPLLTISGDVESAGVAGAFFLSILAVILIVVVSRLIAPKALEYVARKGSQEHLTLTVILIILGTAWASQSLGLSLAMGAFIAGMILSDSEYSHQIILDILPLRDYFSAIFFISIGMMLDLTLFAEGGLQILGLLLVVIILKSLAAFLATLFSGHPPRIAFIAGMRLAQIGEFSLALSKIGADKGILTDLQYQTFIFVSALSMLTAPLMIQASSKLSFYFFSGRGEKVEAVKLGVSSLTDHVVIVGYGMVGQNLSRVLKEVQIPFQIIDIDGERVKRALKEKMNVMYGDSARRGTLKRAGIANARAIVFSTKDHRAAEQGIKLSRKINPGIHIIACARHSSEVDSLMALGADQVIQEEFETSIEIFSRVLREFRMPNNVIEQQIELVRMEGYGMLRGFSLNSESLRKFSTYLTASLTESFQVVEDSWANGQTLKNADIKNRCGAELIAVVRSGEVTANPVEDFKFVEGDMLIMFGRHAPLKKATEILKTGP